MKAPETGKDKVKKICEILRKETLEPAEKEAYETIQKAHTEAGEILAAAKKEADEIRASATLEMEKKKAVFDASLKQACQQTIDTLRQTIVEKLFNPELAQLLSSQLKDEKTIAKLIETIIGSLEKEGVEGDISAYISSAVPAKEVNALLAPKVLEKLREKGVLIGNFGAGVEVKLHKDHLTLDLTENALKELVGSYIRKDFRSMMFGSST